MKRVRKVFQEFSVKLVRRENASRKERLEGIKEFRRQLEGEPSNDNILDSLNRLVEEEERWQVIEALRVRRFSRFHWEKQRDMPSSFFSSYLKDKSRSLGSKIKMGK